VQKKKMVTIEKFAYCVPIWSKWNIWNWKLIDAAINHIWTFQGVIGPIDRDHNRKC